MCSCHLDISGSCGLGGYSIINVDIGLNFNDFMFAVALFFDYGILYQIVLFLILHIIGLTIGHFHCFSPESHYLIDYNNVVEEKFSSIGETISIVFKQMDYSDRIYQVTMSCLMMFLIYTQWNWIWIHFPPRMPLMTCWQLSKVWILWLPSPSVDGITSTVLGSRILQTITLPTWGKRNLVCVCNIFLTHATL